MCHFQSQLKISKPFHKNSCLHPEIVCYSVLLLYSRLMNVHTCVFLFAHMFKEHLFFVPSDSDYLYIYACRGQLVIFYCHVFLSNLISSSQREQGLNAAGADHLSAQLVKYLTFTQRTSSASRYQGTLLKEASIIITLLETEKRDQDS